MTYRFDFDSTNQILRGQLEGRVTDEDLKEFYQLAREHVVRTSPRVGIADLSAVTSFEVSPDTIRDLAKSSPAMPDPSEVRFIVAPAPSIFGLARMFQVEGESTRPNLHVVCTLREVCAILGVQKVNFNPIQTE